MISGDNDTAAAGRNVLDAGELDLPEQPAEETDDWPQDLERPLRKLTRRSGSARCCFL